MEQRVIKFRAWDIDNKRLLNDCLSLQPHGFNKWVQLDKASNNLVWMQFTGLFDRNGKEIYEGDIIKYHDHPTGVEDGIGEVYYKDGKWMVTWSMIPLGDFGTAWTEIIGNIYSNPSPLKQKQ